MMENYFTGNDWKQSHNRATPGPIKTQDYRPTQGQWHYIH